VGGGNFLCNASSAANSRGFDYNEMKRGNPVGSRVWGNCEKHSGWGKRLAEAASKGGGGIPPRHF
jgi:hypothetical protein